jgi:uncharacterized protein YqgC (DUF456 family)
VTVVALAMAVGVAGTVVPLVPGLPLVWAAALLYGVVDGFGLVGMACFAVVTAVAVAGTVAGFTLPQRAAGAAGAARSSIWAGALLAVVGAFVIPVVGLPLGGVFGVYLAERIRTNDAAAARRATLATVRGFGVAALVQLGCAVVMVVTWIGWVAVG